MKYDNITRATFLKRPNRFIAEVEIDGQKEIVHVKNTGRCKELLIPGCEVWLTAPGTPDRKTKYDLVAVRKENGSLFNIDSQAPNKVVKEWLDGQGYDKVVPEYTYGDSRIDFYMECSGEKYLMEVKGCTLEVNGIGYFPDAPCGFYKERLQGNADICDPDGWGIGGQSKCGYSPGIRYCS